ncbi:hypothetical protein AWB75_03700 [Caballeronia catudaia]|uniref:Uncharacterized protein n=1 Tax=Caballeronia catudaia TaxID=1777136 RepID=A0A158BNA8_9BURK|nr:hypothetical protein AWB75_03700 [Caballeronia catudaia]
MIGADHHERDDREDHGTVAAGVNQLGVMSGIEQRF